MEQQYIVDDTYFLKQNFTAGGRIVIKILVSYMEVITRNCSSMKKFKVSFSYFVMFFVIFAIYCFMWKLCSYEIFEIKYELL